ncbi:LexA-binding, inner membrane-associated putative hydrolase [Halomicrobium zhouii]|uniref:LexA-binding, inner membrane-associated putative hydrolase n=1 Tax=Halomicrobium zhouii TaxID=767519 RepID=A0A1I6LSB1_9EURY|nr:metal-dependent hydrolase [Halomicrobium zhouii]SFS06142.1 LexA-binding, inner membrane-associated putative hydrolase [Halomicrobium zhouii]
MFVGHALLAFALVATVARWRGWEPERAIQVGVVAGLFATAPDLDILYGPVGLVGGVSGVMSAAETFWSTGNVTHRGPTHSMVVGLFAAGAFAVWARGSVPARAVAIVVLGGIVTTVGAFSGGLAAIVTALFLAGGLLVCVLGDRWEFGPRSVGLAALAGLLTHPLGDLFTGEPPQLLYPLDVTLLSERIVLHPDPTLNLLAAFAVELAVVWLAIYVAFSLQNRDVRTYVDRRAVLGLAYGGLALLLPAPTLETSYHFVFTVLAFGFVAFPRRRVRRVDAPRVFCTALAVVTCAGLAYASAYVVF